jgi:hypothetical protein
MREYKRPEKTLARVEVSHEMDWVRSCKDGRPAGSHFDVSGPFTEMVLMGNLALYRPGEKILWDGEAMKVTNRDDMDRYIHPTYREGWTL